MDDLPDDLDAQLAALRAQHQDLHIAIASLEEAHIANQLQLRRLKKQKLLLKDEITRLEDMLIPDIIA